MLSTELPLLFCATETWQNSFWNGDMVCDLPNYKLLRCNRIGHTGGGSCIIYNTEICSVVSSDTYNANDYSIVQTTFNFRCFTKSSFNLTCCYLPPTRCSLEIDHDRMFCVYALIYILKNVPEILLGDFNLYMHKLTKS